VNDALSNLVFHHVGVACQSIETESAQFRTLGYETEGDRFDDGAQGVRGLFMVGPGPRMELLEPLASDSPGVLAPWLASGVKLYHLAYLVPSLREAIETMREQRGKLVAGPMPAVAFGGREIAFVVLPNRLLVELVAAGER
jgi:methylmalonyl-CoA/ethylmalonyl-CoA epimerase